MLHLQGGVQVPGMAAGQWAAALTQSVVPQPGSVSRLIYLLQADLY